MKVKEVLMKSYEYVLSYEIINKDYDDLKKSSWRTNHVLTCKERKICFDNELQSLG